MNATFTLQQLQKVCSLSPEDQKRLCSLITRGGVLEATETDKKVYGALHMRNLVAMKAGKIWAKFDINGIRPRPFVGHSVRARDLTGNDIKVFASVFCKRYRKVTGGDYGTFEALDWAFINRMIKEFTEAEFRVMVQIYMRDTKPSKISITDLYKLRQAIFRKLGEATGKAGDLDAEETPTDADAGW